jgi:hypothetical protein
MGIGAERREILREEGGAKRRKKVQNPHPLMNQTPKGCRTQDCPSMLRLSHPPRVLARFALTGVAAPATPPPKSRRTRITMRPRKPLPGSLLEPGRPSGTTPFLDCLRVADNTSGRWRCATINRFASILLCASWRQFCNTYRSACNRSCPPRLGGALGEYGVCGSTTLDSD